MFRKYFTALLLFNFTVLTSSVTICSSNILLSTFTDPLCTSWCKVRLCSSGSCRSVVSGNDPTCECESCTFGSLFGSSSDSNSNQPATGQYYAAGSGGAVTTPNYQNSQNGYNNGFNNDNNMRYNDNGYNNGYSTNNGNSRALASGYGNANGDFNSNQQPANQQYYNNGYRYRR